jgi:hypothetical protein
MATVPETTAARKPSTVYYAHYGDEPGAILKVGDGIYFVADAGEVTELSLADMNFVSVLGLMQLADGQRIADLMAGGAVGVCLSREEGVR